MMLTRNPSCQGGERIKQDQKTHERVCDPAAGKGSRTQREALTLGTSRPSHRRADPLASRQLKMWVRARGGQGLGAVSPAPTAAWLRAGSPHPPHPPTPAPSCPATTPLTGCRLQGPTCSRLHPGLFKCIEVALGLAFKAPGGGRPTSRGHESPGGGAEAGGAPGEEGWLGLEAWWGAAQGPSIPRALVAAPRPTRFPGASPLLSPGPCPLQALAGERQAE